MQKRIRNFIRIWLFVLSSIIFGASYVFAFWPPLQNYTVTPSSQYPTQIEVKVYDPSDSNWHIYTTPSLSSDYCYWDILTSNGILLYSRVDRQTLTCRSNVYAVTYDPGDKQWHTYSSLEISGSDYSYWDIQTKDGIVLYSRIDRQTLTCRSNVYAVTYDPGDKQWHTYSSLEISGSDYSYWDIQTKDDIVVFSRIDRSTLTKIDYIYSIIYDPRVRQWRVYVSPQIQSAPYYTDPRIENDSVYYEEGLISYIKGYDYNTGSWYSGLTKAFAYLVASPTSGSPPLWVWFTDMSIGATSWSWNFADGSSSEERSTYHTYNSYGIFTVTQSVSGLAGSHSATTTIKTDSVTPTGSIIINGGNTNTNATSVTLSLSATDNSGTVSLMQFSNDGSIWSGWETYATSKTWTLTAGDGGKTVYVQFKDAAGNESSSYSDNIILDTTPPTVNSTTPTTGATGVPVDNNIIAIFSESIESTTVNTNTFLLTGPSGSVTGSVNYSNTTATFILSTNLENGATYTVTITTGIKDEAGNPISADYIWSYTTQSSIPPIADFYGEPTTGVIPLQVNFYDISSGNPTIWNWTFGDGTTSTIQNPLHIYQAPGYYTVTLIVSNLCGTSTAIKPNYILSLDTELPSSSAETITPYWKITTPFNIPIIATDNYEVASVSLYYRHQSFGSSIWSGWTSFQTLTVSDMTVIGNFSFSTPSEQGKYEFYTIAIDAVGNKEPIPTYADTSAGHDTDAPTGSIVIDSDATYTKITSVTLTLSGTDNGSGITQMRFSNNSTDWSSWENYTITRSWLIPSGNGSKTVYVQYQDAVGNISGSYTDTIILDMTTPTGGSISINTNAIYTKNTMVNVFWTGAVDTYGLASVGLSNTSSGPYTWYAHDLGLHSWSLSGNEGIDTVYAVFMDPAGNISSKETDTIILDITVPTGGIISINTGATYTRELEVSVDWFSAYDTYGVVSVGLRNSSLDLYTWTPYATGSKTWTLSAGYGTKTVYAVFQDPAGNVSSEVTDAIILMATFNLQVESTPATGVYITVSPTDNNGNSSDYTNFNRNYDQGTTVSLTALSSYGGKPFTKWTKDGIDYSTNQSIMVLIDSNHTLIAEYQLSPVNSFGDFTTNSDTTHWYFEKYADADNPGGFDINTAYGFAVIYQIPGQKGKLSQVFSIPSTGWYTAKTRVLTDISDVSKQQKVYLYLQELTNDSSICGCANQVIYPGMGGLGSAWTWKDLEISYYATGTILAVQVVEINDTSSGTNGSLGIDYIWVYPGTANPSSTVSLNNTTFDDGSLYWTLEPYGDASLAGIWTTAWSCLVLSQDSGMKGKASQWFSPETTGRMYASAWVYSDASNTSNTQKVYLYVFDYNSGWQQIIDSGNAIFQSGKWTPGVWHQLQFIYHPASLNNVVQLVGINPKYTWEALYFDSVEIKQE